uniref:Pheophorbide a oxygenase domain-containing protein n=1 Tax=Aegilops tauschii subsp. strangulata TaxID=200361 RepID=A0A453M5R9_AEGTS
PSPSSSPARALRSRSRSAPPPRPPAAPERRHRPRDGGGSARGCRRRSRPWRRRRPRRRRRPAGRRRRRRRRRGSSTGWTSGTRWPPCATWTPARRTARRCWASAWWPGTTAPWTSGACSTTPARTAWRRSPRAASTTRAASSASTTAGASTAAAPASSSHRPPPSAHLSVHKNSKACVASYPSVVQNNILWFYPRADEEHQDILQRKRPPFIPEIDDPSFVTVYGVRDLPYGYDVLVENLMDPAHVPYAHKGLMGKLRKKEDLEFDVEGGGPVKMKIAEADIAGFLSEQDNSGYFRYVAPCTFYGSPLPKEEKGQKKPPQFMLVFMCVPVSPGKSRVIWAFPRNVGVWLDKVIPRWYYHIGQNAILDSDIYLLHIEERNFAAAGIENWQKAVYVPTSSDNMVIAFRNWFRKHCKSQVGWAAPTVGQLPETPTKDKLMERYWSHVTQCRSCSAALKGMKALEVALQIASVAVVGFLAVAKGTLVTSVVQRAAVVSLAVLCFAASRWLASFIEKNFYFQDYVHAYK